MEKNLNNLKIAGVNYELNYDTERNEYNVKVEGLYVNEIHIREDFSAALGLYKRLTQGK